MPNMFMWYRVSHVNDHISCSDRARDTGHPAGYSDQNIYNEFFPHTLHSFFKGGVHQFS